MNDDIGSDAAAEKIAEKVNKGCNTAVGGCAAGCLGLCAVVVLFFGWLTSFKPTPKPTDPPAVRRGFEHAASHIWRDVRLYNAAGEPYGTVVNPVDKSSGVERVEIRLENGETVHVLRSHINSTENFFVDPNDPAVSANE